MYTPHPQLDKTVPIPLYYQLKSILLNEIQTGTYHIGEAIPTEADLREQYQISRSTVRQAISELVQEGWLERKTSKGTFVTKPSNVSSHIRSFEPFYQQARQLGKTPRTELINLQIVEATPQLAEDLGITPGDRMISMFRRRFADDEPMVTILNYLPYQLCSFIFDHDFKKESLYEVIMQNRASRIAHTKTVVSAEKAQPADVELLNIKAGSPILCFHTISRTENDAVVDFAFSRYRGDLNKFEIDASPEK